MSIFSDITLIVSTSNSRQEHQISLRHKVRSEIGTTRRRKHEISLSLVGQTSCLTLHTFFVTRLVRFPIRNRMFLPTVVTISDRLLNVWFAGLFQWPNWSPITCDLSPFDLFLWDYLKSTFYVTLSLQEQIKGCINKIQPRQFFDQK